ncbi:MAG: SLC13 family permease [Hellea sp.]|jgi:di/tricarboxylate transporter|nr:SLC13 family permease [Hellea sp.]
MELVSISSSWQMWMTMLFVLVAVYLYVTEKYSIESISVGIVTTLMIFFHFFKPEISANFDSTSLLSGFAAPALITIMALLVVGQGLFQTGAFEGPILRINNALDNSPRRTLSIVFILAFSVSMFMNNTPVVVMFIPIISAMALRLRHSTSIYMMPLSFVCILAGMTTLIGSSTNMLVNDVLVRSTDLSLKFFTQFPFGIILATIGSIYIIIAAPILLPNKRKQKNKNQASGQQYIAQIRITEHHPLNTSVPIAGLYPKLKDVTVRMVQRGEKVLLPPFEHALEENDILIVAATRKSLSNLLTSSPEYLKGMLNITGFQKNQKDGDYNQSIVISEAVIAPSSRMIGRNIEQIGFRRQTGCLVLGIQRRSRMIRKSMLDIRLEAGDILLLFGYESEIIELRDNRDLLLLDWSTKELPDIRKSILAQLIFIGTVACAATSFLPIEIAALSGAIAMIASGCLNIRQAVRALDMRIFLLIGAAFAMGLALEKTGGAEYIGLTVVNTFQPYGDQILLSSVFFIIAILTNIISNSAAALLFAPIGLAISQQTGIDPISIVLTVIFATNCSFATPIAYQTNLLVMGPGHYKFSDFALFGIPLIFILWLSFSLLSPYFFNV